MCSCFLAIGRNSKSNNCFRERGEVVWTCLVLAAPCQVNPTQRTTNVFNHCILSPRIFIYWERTVKYCITYFYANIWAVNTENWVLNNDDRLLLQLPSEQWNKMKWNELNQGYLGSFVRYLMRYSEMSQVRYRKILKKNYVIP